jgi:uncharacterized protein
MTHLLDVNALVAVGFREHEFHQRVARWVRAVAKAGSSELATCSITELGFVRVLAQAPQYGITVSQACELLRRLKTTPTVNFTFITDDQDISNLPGWVRTAKETTDGHLKQLADANGAILATLDKRIPGAFLIPAER